MATLQLGTAEIHRVEELTARFPIAALGPSDELLERHAAWLYPRFAADDGQFDMIFQSWVAVLEGRVIVVDPCTGNGRNLPAFPLGHRLDTPFIERFAATGIRPEQVDYVFCTHLHMDHCGWNTTLRDGRFVPTFPNARYIMVRAEFDRWDPRRPGYSPVPANEGVFEASVLPVLEAGLAEIVEPGHAILPGLTVTEAGGHTAGHCALHMVSDERHAWFTGDAFHHPLELVEPSLDMGSCEDFPRALTTRKRLIAQFVASGALIVPAHFAAPSAGYLRDGGSGTVFLPYGD